MTFHVECQSNPDNTMVARFWEYDANIAMMNAEIVSDGRMRVKFPRSAVLYLRHNAGTPDKLTIELVSDKCDVVALHEIPLVKTQRYTIEELLRKDLLFLVPFHAFTHEKKLPEYDTDEKKFAVMLKELKSIKQKLNDEIGAGRIDSLMRSAILTAMLSVLRGLGGEFKNVMKGVEATMRGQILDFEAIRIHDKAWEEGEAAGKMNILFDLVSKGRLTDVEASEEIKMPVADFRERMNEYDRAHA